MKCKTLPKGIYSNKQYVLSVIYLCICLFIGIGIGILCIDKKINLFFCFLIAIPIIFFVSIILLANFNPHFKADMQYRKDADPEKFIQKIDALLQNNLHSDSRKFLMLMKVNACFCYDKEKAYEIFEYISFPEDKNFKQIFMQIKALYYINRNELDSANKVLEAMILDKYSDASIKTIRTSLDIFNPDVEIKDVEEKYKQKNIFVLLDVLNANTLMNYYIVRKDIKKGKMYAHIILSKKHKLYEITKEAELINKLES